MNSRKLLIGCGLAVILGLGLVVVIGIVASSIPGVDQQIPAGRGSGLVNISLPLNIGLRLKQALSGL